MTGSNDQSSASQAAQPLLAWRVTRTIRIPHIPRLTFGLLALLLGLGSMPAAAQNSTASSAVTGPGAILRETDGAWQRYCKTPAGAAEEQCELVQNVTAEDRPNVGLTVEFYEAPQSGAKMLRVVAPLGVLLPKGLGLNIDGQDMGTAPFVKCSKNGCISEVKLQDEVVDKMKTGKNAVFIIYDTPESGIGIPISLQGFAQGLKGVK